MKPDNLLTLGYMAKHPDNAARVLESLPYTMTADLLEQLSPEAYLDAFQYIIPSYAAGLFETLREEPRQKLMDALSHEKLAMLLALLDDAERKEILAQLAPEKRKKIIAKMQYPRDTVGSIMVPPVFSLPQDISVAEALKRIKASRHFHFSEAIVLDNALRYIGMVSLDKLIQAASDKKLSAVVNYKIPALPARKSLQNLTENPAWTSVRVLPVIDGRGLLIGILDYATLQQHNEMEISLVKSQPAKQATAPELFFQTLAILIEALVHKMSPADKTNTSRDKQHDKVI